MNELPNGWAPATLGQVCDRGKYGWTTRAAGNGSVKFLRTTDITKGPINWANVPYCEEAPSDMEAYGLKPRDILISRAGSVGFSALIDEVKEPSVFASYLIRFVPAREVDARYLASFLRSPDYWRQIGEASAGIALANVNASKLAEVELPLAPLAEQKRIADKLEAVLGRVDACRARLDRVPALLKRFRQSVLAAATSGQLTENWRTQHSDENAIGLIKCAAASRHHLYKDYSPNSDLPLHEIPDSWAWASLRFILSPDEAFCYGVVQPGENDPSGSLLIRAGDLVGGRVDFSELRRIPRVVHEDYHRSQLKGGEVLVTVVGAGIGTTAIAQPECAGCNIARAVAKLPIRDFNAQFVHCWLSTSRALSWLKHESREVARPTLNLEQLQKLPVPIPPLAEQAEIVRRVEALFAFADRIEARLTAARAQVERLTPATLAKAFRGELVPQDPADEPASALLERLRHPSTASATPAKRGKRAKSV